MTGTGTYVEQIDVKMDMLGVQQLGVAVSTQAVFWY